MTQHQLIIEYLMKFHTIVPAKKYGDFYKGQIFGSETSKRCRELRKKGVLGSYKEGKFEVFYLNTGWNSSMVERASEERKVVGSIPTSSTNYKEIEEAAFARLLR